MFITVSSVVLEPSSANAEQPATPVKAHNTTATGDRAPNAVPASLAGLRRDGLPGFLLDKVGVDHRPGERARRGRRAHLRAEVGDVPGGRYGSYERPACRGKRLCRCGKLGA